MAIIMTAPAAFGPGDVTYAPYGAYTVQPDRTISVDDARDVPALEASGYTVAAAPEPEPAPAPDTTPAPLPEPEPLDEPAEEPTPEPATEPTADAAPDAEPAP